VRATPHRLASLRKDLRLAPYALALAPRCLCSFSLLRLKPAPYAPEIRFPPPRSFPHHPFLIFPRRLQQTVGQFCSPLSPQTVFVRLVTSHLLFLFFSLPPRQTGDFRLRSPPPRVGTPKGIPKCSKLFHFFFFFSGRPSPQPFAGFFPPSQQTPD